MAETHHPHDDNSHTLIMMGADELTLPTNTSDSPPSPIATAAAVQKDAASMGTSPPPSNDVENSTPPTQLPTIVLKLPIPREPTPDIPPSIVKKSRLGDAKRSLAVHKSRETRDIYNKAFQRGIARIRAVCMDISKESHIKYEKVEADMFAAMQVKHKRAANAWNAYVKKELDQRNEGMHSLVSCRWVVNYLTQDCREVNASRSAKCRVILKFERPMKNFSMKN